MSLAFNIPWESFLSLTILHFFAVIAPGPALIIQMNLSINKGRKIGNYCALGIGVGIGIHLLYTFLGLAQLIDSTVWLSNLVIILAVCYFSYLAYGLMKTPRTSQQIEVKEVQSTSKDAITAFTQGFVASAINPNAIVFSITVFSPIIDPSWTYFTCFLLLLWLFINCVVIYMGFNMVFSTPKISAYYFRHRYIFDRVIAVFFIYLIICFGAKMLPENVVAPIAFLLKF